MCLTVNELSFSGITRIDLARLSLTFFNIILILLELPRDLQRSQTIGTRPNFQGNLLSLRLRCSAHSDELAMLAIAASAIAISPVIAFKSSRVQLRAQRRHRNYCNPIWSNVAVTTWRDHTEHAWFAGQRVIDLGRKLQK